MPKHSATRHGSRSRASICSSFRDHASTAGISAGCALRHSTSRSGTVTNSLSPYDWQKRILEDLRAWKEGANGGDLLEEHRRRTWEIFFGEQGADGVEVSTTEISLFCPFSRCPMRHPVRSRECVHLQCCDLDSWTALFNQQRAMRDPKGPCPVCNKCVYASSLELDLWQLHVLSQMPAGTNTLLLNADGSYCSGDISRIQRKEQATEFVDVTQDASQGPISDVDSVPCDSPVPVKVKVEQLSHESHRSHSLVYDEKDVIVHFEKAREVRTVLNEARSWAAHCPKCSTPMSKTEMGTEKHCKTCGVSQQGWTLVRRFCESDISLELTGDGTLLLCRSDPLAPYLFRAGFTRSVIEMPDGLCNQDDTGLWCTTTSLKLYELDFLEACCERLARGEAVDNMPSVPEIFRIPRCRRTDKTAQLSLDSLAQ
ncbi:MIZ SP RING zinc finger [Trypanosoma vivax]|uniref:SP-RING-type domain-containing protein n=1 Tax=Trypanosoma vivax (strain Y486) TaxID=1055687 RepID=G0U9M5_TRYVY|nr:hypothetical protein TRVL_02601 [Trypanosoma vivax]KAH8605050.1 MIZ SP RING zinc finger [Trypanosoma vivax]CCC54311.1 conserved hypothetical protein [Trypanosoma vivax Y486]